MKTWYIMAKWYIKFRHISTPKAWDHLSFSLIGSQVVQMDKTIFCWTTLLYSDTYP